MRRRLLQRCRRQLFAMLTLLLILPLAACGDGANGGGGGRGGVDNKELDDFFPRSQLTIQSGARSHRFDVWLATTADERERGLMFVKQLPRNRGMLFVFPQPQTVSMWMKNTLISLDMLFIDAQGRVVRIAERTEPYSLASISSIGDALGVLEIAGGEAARLGIKTGDIVRHTAFTRPAAVR